MKLVLARTFTTLSIACSLCLSVVSGSALSSSQARQLEQVHPDLAETTDSSTHESHAHGLNSSIPNADIHHPPPSPHAAHGSGKEHGHSHGHGGHHQPQVELNETDVHYWHQFPASYLAADFRLAKDQAIFGEELDDTWSPEHAGGHRGFAFLHAGLFLVAYFGLLPIGLALRAAGHSGHHLVNVVFLIVATLSWLALVGYRAASPNRYENSSHAVLSNGLYFLSVGLTAFDSLQVVQRAIVLCGQKGDRSLSEIIRHALEPEGGMCSERSQYEMVGMNEENEIVFSLGDDEDGDDGDTNIPRLPIRADRGSMTPNEDSLILQQYQRHSRTAPSRSSSGSSGSDGTLHEEPLEMGDYPKPHEIRGAYDQNPHNDQEVGEQRHDGSERDTTVIWVPKHERMTIRRFGEICLTWLRRTQVVIAYVTVLAGIVVYTGMCRASFLPSCLAHYIKGSIFFGYGILTFARYLGAYADLGWAWNRRPDGTHGPTAEMVECGVIFTYGVTQTWMERIGSHAGDPYTVKQVQHISIAVMFWFAGLGGMLLESRRMRGMMSNIAGRRREEQVEPASYGFSFNPLPALVIAVTGLAMAAHHQNYVFQVEIHSLWGILLAGGSLFRMLTYFFLFIRPPVESILPSRPPTEILTSFGWTAGGIVFMLSNEEVTFAAMRTGYDDMMAFLNFTIAVTSAIFCWEVVVMGVKGWAVGRVNQRKLVLGQGQRV